jgi:hypothetical protein
MITRLRLLVTLSILLLSLTTFAQSLKTNDNAVNLGIGFGSTVTYGHGMKGFPAVSVSYEHILPKEIGPGLLGVGIIAAYRSTSYKETFDDDEYEAVTYKFRYSNTYLGLRATYHWKGLVSDKYDVYGAVVTGVRLEKYKWDAPHNTYGVLENYNHTKVFAGLVVGARYYFAPKVSVFSELGYDVTWIKFGISARL